LEANFTWVGFKELINDRIAYEYQELREGMNLVQMKHIGSLKAYVRDFNDQMNTTPKMDEFSKKCVFLDGLQKWVVDALFKFPKLPEDVAGIIEIAEQIKRKSNSPFQQSYFNKNVPRGKRRKNFVSGQKSKDQSGGRSFNKGDHQNGNPSNTSDKRGGKNIIVAMDLAKVVTSL
jgi:hypothetical protein